MSNTFSLLWGSIIHSSLWVRESKETRLVFISMLAMKDAEGVVRASVIGMADAAKVSPDECRAALEALKSPDLDDTSKVDEGRRIREVPGGWQIVNHEKYQFSTETKREAWRLRKAKQRALEIMSPEQREEYDAMTPAEKASYEIGVIHEYSERRKLGIRAAAKKGRMAGAKQAIVDGLQDASGST